MLIISKYYYMKKVVILILIVGVCYSKLYQVVTLFRHGARYHLNSYYDGNSTFDTWGQLTPVGMRQHQNLGKMLAKDYKQNLNFISQKYDKKEIQVYSTGFNRTIMSALSLLYGLYPPGNGPQLIKVQQKYHLPPFSNQTDINQQKYAFPYGHQHIMIKYNETLILQNRNCPKMQQMWQNNFKKYSIDYEQMNVTYTPFIKKLIQRFALPSNATFQTIADLFDTLVVNKYLGKPLPQNFTQTDFNNLEHLYYWLNNMKYTNQAAQVLNSKKYQKIINDFDKRINNLKSYPLKYTFFSVHDTDIIPFRTDMNLSSYQCIEQIYRKGRTNALNCQNTLGFASNLILELHSDNDKDFYVMIRSQGKYMNLCQRKQTKCDWLDFKNRMKKSIVKNVQQLCGAHNHIDKDN